MTAPHSSFARLGPLVLFGSLLVLGVGIEHTIVGRADFSQHPALPIGVACDLLLVLPALFYWCVVRPYKLPFSTLAAAFGGGLALSHWLLPTASLAILAWAGRLSAGLEAVAVGYAAVRLRRIRRAYQAARQYSTDFIDNLHVACQPVLGRLTGGLVSEIALFYYALLGGWAQPEVQPGEQVFSNYQRSGFTALLATLGGLGLIEAAAAHLVLGHWYPRGAWLLTLPSLYTLLFLVAHGWAARLRPVTVSARSLVVRTGLMWRAVIPRAQVLAVDLLSEAPTPAADCLNAAAQLLTPPNLLLTLAAPQVVQGPYGLRRNVSRLAIYVDEPAALQQALSA
ncbi:hypothetical protein [uncultured Hymenobacter sp.]|uniref:hypothetical protein n=1 Tax=uncultured Hymenobacter sp. TaxID=170016 RepID=UPI0035CC12DD